MKFFRVFLVMLFLAAFSPPALFAQEKPFSITGRLNGIDARYVTLIYWRGRNQVKDTASVAGGGYVFKGTVAGESTAILKEGLPDDPADTNHLLLFFFDGESFRITHHGKFSAATFEGSPAETEYLKLRAAGKAWYADAAKASGARLDSLQASKADVVYGDYMRSNPGSPLLVFAFNKYYAGSRGHNDPDKVMALFEMLPDSVKELASSKAFVQQITNGKTYNTVVTIGRPAPDFTMEDTSGRAVALSSFRGHYVLLDFWASWCGPCRAENPNVVREYAKYHDKGFDILSVSLDQPGKKESWLKAIHDDKLTWNHVSDLKFWDNAAVRLYGVQGIPQNFLIDPQGRIVARNLRGEELDRQLAQVYKN